MIFQDLFVKQKVQKNSICLKHLVALCLNYHFWSNECILAVKKVGYLKKKKNTDPSLPNLKYTWETKSEGKSDWPSCYCIWCHCRRGRVQWEICCNENKWHKCVIGGRHSQEKDILCWEGWHCQSSVTLRQTHLSWLKLTDPHTRTRVCCTCPVCCLFTVWLFSRTYWDAYVDNILKE